MDSGRLDPDGFPLWRQFRAEPRFAAGVGAVVLLAALLLGSVFPVWRVGPGSSPFVIRISGLAWIESRLQGLQATETSAEVDPDLELRLLRQALALDPTNLGALRASVRRHALKPLRRPAESGRRIREVLWLLRVSGTNHADVPGALAVFEDLEADDLIPPFVAGLRNPGPTELEAALRSLLRSADPRFPACRRRLGPAPPGSPLEVLDHAATALWSAEAATRSAARRELERIADESRDSRGRLAARLGVVVAARAGNLGEHLEALERATRLGVDRPRLHAEAWRRLRSEGRTEEAIRRAAEFQAAPCDAWESASVADALAELGRVGDGLRYLELHGEGAEPQEAVWRCRCRLLERAGRWEELLGLALELRRRPTGKAPLGESHAVEGRALWGMGRIAEAESRFREAAQAGFVGAQAALLAARWCEEGGFLALALEVLRAAEPFPSEAVGHANECFRLALEIGDPEAIGDCGRAGRGAGAGVHPRLVANRLLALEALDGDVGESLLAWESPALRTASGTERGLLGALVFRRLGMSAMAWSLLGNGANAEETGAAEPLGILAAAECLEGMGRSGEALGLLARLDPDFLAPGFLPRLERLERRLEAASESPEENRN